MVKYLSLTLKRPVLVVRCSGKAATSLLSNRSVEEKVRNHQDHRPYCLSQPLAPMTHRNG
eukprot:1151203-Prorocentrum_lima.AAC.1